MNESEKKSSQQDSVNEGLFFTRRSLSCGLAALIGLFFVVFMIGYFWGHKKAIEQLTYRIQQDSLADHIYSSMCGLYDNKTEGESSEDGEQANSDTAGSESKELGVQVEAEIVPVAEKKPEHKEHDTPKIIKKWQAQLAGFNTQESAKKWADRLTVRGYDVIINERKSRTSKGKELFWYQVVTSSYDDRAILEKIVDKIKKEEKLKDVVFVSC